jgi:uncharacterized repeat protein (TIGR03803 family)
MHRTSAFAIALLCGVAFMAGGAPAHAGKFKLLYSFKGGVSDGATPLADLIAVGGTLYGTTSAGGGAGQGTVFSLDLKTGTETVLHAFAGGSDGAAPAAGLLKFGNTLYGTTTGGGSAGQGTVFSLDLATGAEQVVHTFQGGTTDGAYPQARLIEAGGLLYGTTMEGGSSTCFFGCGTVFSIDPATGAEKILHVFQSGSDGANPASGLIKAGRKLYGTTLSGGAGDAGTVFALNPATGAEKALHYFDKQGDGTNPISGLIDAGGMLYGATIAGGVSGNGLGTVYAIDRKTSAEHVAYNFEGTTDGALPEGGVIAINGILYGTTSLGGDTNDGVVFSLDPATGAETVLHVFAGSGGANPWAGLIKVGGTLYGTTYGGGSAGGGVIFAIKP